MVIYVFVVVYFYFFYSFSHSRTVSLGYHRDPLSFTVIYAFLDMYMCLNDFTLSVLSEAA